MGTKREFLIESVALGEVAPDEVSKYWDCDCNCGPGDCTCTCKCTCTDGQWNTVDESAGDEVGDWSWYNTYHVAGDWSLPG